jgi:hypothetical protein
MIDMNHKYQTRDGRAVEILRTNVKNVNFPIVGIITERNGYETQDRWAADGCYYGNSESEHDLIPVPTKHEAWMPVSYDRDGAYWVNGRLFDSQEEVGITMGRTRIAHVTWED